SEILIACLVCIQLTSQVVGEVLWIAMNPVGRVVVLNKAWYGATLLAGLGLAVAYQAQSTWMLFAIAPLPYFAVAIWLRFALKEPMLVHGVGAGAALRLLIPIGVASAAGRLSLYWVGNTALGMCVALPLIALAFALTMRIIRIFSAEEVQLTKHFSTALSKSIQPFSAMS
ncbi:MAG: hypothetical protein PHF58_13220, partial [Methylotenera sp.]|nr:hypothetical protein [Methylotenera sp.]